MIKKCAGISGALIYKKPSRKGTVPMWQIKFAKYESLKLLRLLYYTDNLPTLKRKRDIANKLLLNVKDNKLIRLPLEQ